MSSRPLGRVILVKAPLKGGDGWPTWKETETGMPEKNSAALEFLATRRSRPAKTLTAPAPDRAELTALLEIASRAPDHGKLVPWRFVVLEKPALARLVAAIPPRAEATGLAEWKGRSVAELYGSAELVVAVVFSPKEGNIPEIEQLYAAGGVCLSLLNAALASGWGANWISGWISHDTDFMAQEIGLKEGEKVAGLIHLGTDTAHPGERPRPEVSEITTWMDA